MGTNHIAEDNERADRREALHQAVQAQTKDEDPASTVKRANAFYDFLSRTGDAQSTGTPEG